MFNSTFYIFYLATVSIFLFSFLYLTLFTKLTVSVFDELTLEFVSLCLFNLPLVFVFFRPQRSAWEAVMYSGKERNSNKHSTLFHVKTEL